MRTIALHMLADWLLFLSAASAPVPRERPVTAAELVGVWRYSWGGVPGVMGLREDGAYLALHGDAQQQYAGVWWLDSAGRVVIVEYVTDCDGVQRGAPIRREFDVRRTRCGYALDRGITVTLTRGE